MKRENSRHSKINLTTDIRSLYTAADIKCVDKHTMATSDGPCTVNENDGVALIEITPKQQFANPALVDVRNSRKLY